MDDQPVLDLEVREVATDYEAAAASGARETSGNPYVAVVNLLDAMTEDDVVFDVNFRGEDSDESSS